MEVTEMVLVLVCLTGVLQTAACQNTTQRCGDKQVLKVSLTDSNKTGDVIVTFNDQISIRGTCDYFTVENNTEIVLTKDIKNVCGQLTCSINCDGQNTDVNIYVEITRSEVYTLRFHASSYSASVRELTPLGTKLTINPQIDAYIEECINDTANDVRAGNRFELQDSHGPFLWKVESSSDSLEVGGDLDYERTKSIDVKLNYTNSDFNGNVTTTIHIEILDVDDQDPVFNHAVYFLNIEEENRTIVNKELETKPPIYAYDQDVGINTTLIYSIIDQDKAGLFRINNATGLLSVTGVLDREQQSTYTLYIQAAQINNNFRTATATVNVTVLDIDDNLPKFDQHRYDVKINEEASRGTTVVIVTATDPDEGTNAQFNYTITNTSVPVEIDPDSGEITVSDSTKFDRESYDGGILYVQVKTVPGNDSTMVNITLIDINDNNPNFTQTEYTFFVLEAEQNDVIGTVLATDKDEGPNANITYEFVKSSQMCTTGSGGRFPFTMDTYVGNITVTGSLLCELYTVLVEACDNPLQISTRRCSVTSIRISHNSTTELGNVTQKMDVLENSPNETTVGVVQYPGSLYTIQNDDGTFKIDSNIGLVKTNAILDRENTSLYTVLVNVSSLGQVIFHVNISVAVTDVNDNAPVFIDSDSYTFSLKEDTSVGIVQADDSDEGKNADITYSLQNQREHRFSINSTSGEILTNFDQRDFDFDIIRLTMIAQDQGTPSLKTTESIYIVPKAQPADRIPILTGLSETQIRDGTTGFESELLQITGIPLAIRQISPREKGSMIQLENLNQTLSQKTVLAVIMDNYEAIKSLFYTGQSSPVAEKSFGAAEIGLIVLGAVILIGAILAVVIVRKQCNKAENYQHLYESLTRNSSIYESQEIKVKIEDDASQLNGTSNIEDMNTTDPGVVTAMVNNPLFVADDYEDVTEVKTDFTTTDENANRPKSINSSETSVEEAMESLEQLSDRLDQEGGENGNAVVYANVDTSVDPGSSANSLSEIDAVFVDDTSENNNDTDKSEEGKVDVNVSGDDDDDDDDDSDSHNDDLAKKILQAQSKSPVMSRRHGESVDDVDDNEDENKITEVEEPDPDYDVKQVRFATEVLVAAGNKVEPPTGTKDVKEKDTKDNNRTDDNDNGKEENKRPDSPVAFQDLETTGEDEENGEDDGKPVDLMLEEEINSPVDFLTDTPNGDFYFGAEEESTHF